MRVLLVLTAILIGSLPGVTAAQSQFSPAITVNDRVITNFELAQRIKLLELFRTPGNLPEVARTQLIEDRLKQGVFEREGLQLTSEGLQSELESFAGRANLELEQFYGVLAQSGVAPETLQDFVRNGVMWRDYVRAKFNRQVNVSEADIDRAVAGRRDSATGIEVLLSEIIIPAPPPRAAQAQAQAERISRLTSTQAFSAQARQVSALPSRNNGGRLGWLPLSNFPAPLRPLFLQLSEGEVTAPIPITNGVALFQLRGIREAAQARPAPTAIEYAALYLAGADEAAAQSVADRVDVCDDLYGEARGLPEEVLERGVLPVAEIPQDVALELARLDPGEVSYALTRADGSTRVFLMLCNRRYGEAGAEGDEIDRDAVRNQLRSQRLAGLAAALLEDLRAAAVING